MVMFALPYWLATPAASKNVELRLSIACDQV